MSLKTIKECNDRLASLGEKRQVFKSLKQAQATVEQVEKRVSAKALPAASVKAALKSVLSVRESLIAQISAEQAPRAKAELYGKLSASLLTEIGNEKDAAKKVELTREFMRAQKHEAYCLHAIAQTDPKAVLAAKLLR